MATDVDGHIVAAVFERILVGYAGDQAGRDAAALAAQCASLAGAELTIAYPYHPLFAGTTSGEAEQRSRDELDALLERDVSVLSARYRWSSASWPVRALHELAVYENAGLIVFGAAHERFALSHITLMERMVHGAPCAVAVAPGGYAERERCEPLRVGIGFADTEEGRAALELGCELAERSGQAARVIAGCGLRPTLQGDASLAPELRAIEDERFQELTTAVERRTRELDSPLGVKLDVRRGDPNRVLVEVSRQLDLLVLGSRAYGPLRHALLGSVSAEVMRSAHCAVLVLPRGVDVTSPTGTGSTELATA
jgi:nucleotide-binding universal stress UspA family protein